MEHNNRRIKIKASYYILSILSIGYFLMFLVIYLPSHSYYYDDKSQVAVVGTVDVFAAGFKRLLNEQQANILSLPKLSTNENNTVVDLTRKQSITVSGVREIYSVDLNNFKPTNYLNTSMAFFADVNDEDVIVTWVEGNNLYIGERNGVRPGPSMLSAFSNLNGVSIERNRLRSINLADFNTSNVTDMSVMFYHVGSNVTSFTLDLGNEFNTINVTNMYGMFSKAGYISTIFALSLGNKFNTWKVTDMNSMFRNCGRTNPSFTFDIGSHFNPSNVTNMEFMFSFTGGSSTDFTLNLGSYFNPANVITMTNMFDSVAANSTNFVLDLGPQFNPINVTDMSYMFFQAGNGATNFNLNLGLNFNTSNVTNMRSMFENAGRMSLDFSLDLGPQFNTINVTDMFYMFYRVAHNSNTFFLNFGSEFNTINVTTMDNMFRGVGRYTAEWTLNLQSFVINNSSVVLTNFARNMGATNIIFGGGWGNASTSHLNNNFLLYGKQTTVHGNSTFHSYRIGNNTMWTRWRGSGNTTFILDIP